MRCTVVALGLAFSVTRASAQDLSSLQQMQVFNQQVQLQIDLNLMLQTQDLARSQMAEMQRIMESSPAGSAQKYSDVIPAAAPAADVTAIPTFWPKPDRFRGRVEVTLSTPTPFATIYYTTDGSIPTVHSAQYKAPIVVDKTAKVLAIAVAPDHWQSPTAIGAYEIR